MAGEDKHSKKHPASDHKKRQLKKKGQVPKSQDVPMALGLVAAFGTMLALKGFFVEHFSGLMQAFFSTIKDPDNIDIYALIQTALKEILLLSMPVLMAVMIVAVIGHLSQGGLILATEPLIPKMSKLNPMTKIKQWFSVRSLQDLMKSLVKILAAGYVGYMAWKDALPAIVTSVDLSALGLMALGATIIKSMFVKVIILYVVIAMIDYGFQKRNFLNQHKMTDKEVKDEYKQQEGDPYQKAKRRQMAQQLAMQQSQEHVPQGDVSIINPTELAITLKYDPEVSPVPYVIAKGEKRLADDIRESSRKHGIPVVRNKPLARALFELCEIGDIVPAELFKPVAEVLAYVFALKEQGSGDAAAAVAAQQPAQAAASAATSQDGDALHVHDLASITVPVVAPATMTANGWSPTSGMAGGAVTQGPIHGAPYPTGEGTRAGASGTSHADSPVMPHASSPVTPHPTTYGDDQTPPQDQPFSWRT